MFGRRICLLVVLAVGFLNVSCNENDGGCEDGAMGCTCRTQWDCTAPADEQGVMCDAGICTSCEAGREACACMENQTCLPGLACERSTQTCTYDDEALRPPSKPKCYTPCESGFTDANGAHIPCPADKLLDGCIGDATCVHGSCVVSGKAVATCTSDISCPDFQRCFGGTCFSNCDMDSECTDGDKCYRHVCRRTCTTAVNRCDIGDYCSTLDGENGHCMQLADPEGERHVEIDGTFHLEQNSLQFSNVHVMESFVITNDSPASVEFTVRKVEHREFDNTGFTIVSDNPLHWVTMGANGALDQVQEFLIRIDGNGGTATLSVGSAHNPALSRWEGVVEIDSADLGRRRLELSYMGRPDGQWAGHMYHFASFPDNGIDAWLSDESSQTLLQNVGNAFVHRWAAFKAGLISYDEFKAVIDTTVNQSWKWPLMDSYCPSPATACYPYNNPQGYSLYTSSRTQYPIPGASNQLPIAMNLKADPSITDGTVLRGKISSAHALQYAGQPEVTLSLAQNPANCSPNAIGTVICDMVTFDANIYVGGRYATTSADVDCNETAAGSFALMRTPWLLPGFTTGTEVDPESGLRYRYECRDKLLPFGDEPAFQEINTSFATSNPISDGRTRKRKIEIVDGALVNASEMVILFRETFESFLGASDDSGFSAYGLMVMQRSVADLPDDAFEGASPMDSRAAPEGILKVSCSEEVLSAAIDDTQFPATNTALLNRLAGSLVDGVAPGTSPVPIAPSDTEKVHYFCEDTGLIDGGSGDDGSATATPFTCPPGSKVQYFVATALTQWDAAGLPCQAAFIEGTHGGVESKGTCQQTLNVWRRNGTYNLVTDPVWRCTNSNEAYCSTNRLDMREGKDFYLPTEPAAVFLPLRADVENAFRYKTRFRNRSGKSVGFAPEICIPNSDAIPYCYDPKSIEQVRARVDCAVAIYTEHLDDLTTTNKISLQSYLAANFSFEEEIIEGLALPFVHDGFERLYAELHIMMGDEAYTKAFASRFDLAGSSLLSFEGALFEPGGINLSGGAGYEMYNLYQAVQYFQAPLDRFYSLSPLLWASIGTLGPDNGYISKDTVVTYFDRLIRASSQKSRAWSEIATRYQHFNRPDLARLVVERAYTSAYLEAVVLSRMMLKLESIVAPEDRPQLVQRVELAQLVYRSALLRMRDGYTGITDNMTLFGFLPDYIPFPALDDGDTNAFEKALGSAQGALEISADKEERALEGNRSYETDAAVFQSELVSIRNNYENRLAEICGTFEGDDGRIYPATPKYGYLSDKLQTLGNACGFVGNGELHNAMVETEVAGLDLQDVVLRYNNLIAEIEIERTRVSQQCGEIYELSAYRMTIGGTVLGLEEAIRYTQVTLGTARRIHELVGKMAETKKCIIIAGTAGGSDCPAAIVATAEVGIAGAILETVTIVGEIAIAGMESGINALELAQTKWETDQECDFARIESDAAIKTLILGLKNIELEAVKQSYRVKQANAEAQRLRGEAARVMAEQSETEQLTINIEAARNDPNVRIYKNDAILAADRTFTAAVREAYRATKVYEYYTSQSYAYLGDLFLVRMASFGDISLEAYLRDLSEAFYEFEEHYGNPDTRVTVLSLRDDILATPRIGDGGVALSEGQRLSLFRETLSDVTRLDARGYLTMSFSTNFDLLSPLTSTHKVLGLQAEIVGSDVGDSIGRIYLQQKGTGVVRRVDGETSFYGFPERTAVVNTFFNGEKLFDDAVYTNLRLRDRPLVNTHWELVVNQKDEMANKDINLNSLTDVRLYITYTDFTNL